jgi:hypothetical protein
MTGLSTGAVTGMPDRLERAGYVTRAQDPRRPPPRHRLPDQARFDRDIQQHATNLGLLSDELADSAVAVADQRGLTCKGLHQGLIPKFELGASRLCTAVNGVFDSKSRIESLDCAERKVD